MNKIDKVINWFEERQGKVDYSMEERNGKTGKYDCSSAVYFALVEAFNKSYTHICNTSTLPQFLQNLGYRCIAKNNSWEAKKGDIIIWCKYVGVPGTEAHTGIFINNSEIIHCNYDNNGISINTEKSLSKLYNWNWFVYRLDDDKNIDTIFSSIEHVTERFMVKGSYSIDTLPWWCFDKVNVGSTEKYNGYVVTVTKKWGNYFYSQYLGGWVDYRAFQEVESINEEKTIINSGYSIDTLPWGEYGYNTVDKSANHLNEKVIVTAKRGSYLYIHKMAKWIDEKAFS